MLRHLSAMSAILPYPMKGAWLLPTGVAAAALYIAAVLLGERKTQRDVADIAGVTEVTIRNRYKELTEQLEMGVTL